MTNLTVLPRTYNDPAATLRMIAEQIDAGELDGVSTVGIVVFGDEVSVFGAGREGAPTTILAVLMAGVHKLTRALVER